MKKKQKEKRNVGGNGIKTIVFTLIFSIAIFIALMIVEYNVNSRFEKKEVIVAITSITKGQQVTADNVDDFFKKIKVDKNAIASDAIDNLEISNDIIITTNISANEQLTSNKYIDIEKYLTNNYKEPTSFSCKVENLSYSVAGTLRRGNIVDIYGYDRRAAKVILIKSGVLLLGAYDSNGVSIDGNKEGATIVFNLLVEKEELQSFIEEINGCSNITFVNTNNVN